MILRIVLTLLVLLPSMAYSMDNNLFKDMMDKIDARDFTAIEKFLKNDQSMYSKDPEFYVIL